jgi:hypothetical protein
LAGSTHLLASFGWCARSMAKALDILREKVILIKKNPHLIIDESFMMNMLSSLMHLTPFKEYLEFMYTKQRISFTAR